MTSRKIKLALPVIAMTLCDIIQNLQLLIDTMWVPAWRAPGVSAVSEMQFIPVWLDMDEIASHKVSIHVRYCNFGILWYLADLPLQNGNL